MKKIIIIILITLLLSSCMSNNNTDAIVSSRTDTYQVINVSRHYGKYHGSIYVDLLRDSDHVLYKHVFVTNIDDNSECSILVAKGAYVRLTRNTYNEFTKTWEGFEVDYLNRCLCHGNCSGNK